MPIHYSIDQSLCLIEERWTGTIAISDLKKFWLHFLEDEQVMEFRRTLVDLRSANLQFTGYELDSLVRSDVIPKLKGLTWISAIVVSEPVQYGVSRQYSVFAGTYSKDSIFFEYEEAKEWLLNQP
jgi:hypothetical protein